MSRTLCRVFAAGLVAAFLGASASGDPLNPFEFPSLGIVTLGPGTYTLNTDTLQLSGGTLGSPLTGTLSTASGGRGTAVFCFSSLTASPASTIVVTGSRMVALLSQFGMAIHGNIVASGSGGTAGGSNSGSTPGAAGSRGVGVAGGLAGGDGGAGAYGGVNDGGVPGWAGSGNGAGSGGSAGVSQKGGGGTGGGFGGNGGNNANSAYGNILARLEAGSGGGGGGGSRTGNSTNGGTGGSGGGAGGGAIELGAMMTLTISGAISCRGGNGSDSVNGFGAGAGGGGSGGAVLVHAREVSLGAIVASGGSGGIAGSGGPGGNGGSGGAGGGGRVAIQSLTTPSLASVSVSGANAGVLTIVRPAIGVSDLDFGDVTLGESKTLFMAATNMGDEGSCINGIFPEASGAFARVGTGVFSSLKPGGAAACGYTFTPSGFGSSEQTQLMTTNAGLVLVTLRGVGVAQNCAADLDINGVVDDADFQIFITEYNALLCP